MEIKDESFLDIFKTRSMLPMSPVLTELPMAGVHSLVELYRIFRFDPMHVLSLGLSRLLKECTSTSPRDEYMRTSAMMSSTGSCRTFEHVKTSVLHYMNVLHRDFEPNPIGYALHVDLSKGG